LVQLPGYDSSCAYFLKADLRMAMKIAAQGLSVIEQLLGFV
jgi:hypothetical protein